MSLRLGVLLGLRGLAFCGLGLVGLGVFRLGYLGRCDGRTFGDCFDIEGVDRGVARADGLACLVDAVTELAIVNDLAAFGRLDGGVLNLDGADCLAVSAHGTAKIAAVSPSAVTLLRMIEMTAGVTPSLVWAMMPMFSPWGSRLVSPSWFSL